MKGNLFPIGIILVAYLIGFVSIPNLPDEMAIHWTSGEADQYINKIAGVIIIPSLMVLTQLLFVLFIRKSAMHKESNKTKKILSISTLTFLLFIQAAVILFNINESLNIEFVCAILAGVLIIILGNYMQTVKTNAVYGVRTPWSMQNEDVWRLTNRFSAKIFVAIGFAIIVLAFLFPTNIILIMLALVVLAGIISVYSSYYYHKKVSNV